MNILLPRRSFLETSLGAIAGFGFVGCGRNGASQVSEETIDNAATELAEAIVQAMNEFRPTLESGATVYAVALVVLDDSSDVQLYTNTDQHLATTDGTDFDRWYFGEFWSEGLPVNFDALTKHLGEVEDWDESPEKGNAVSWLVAMTRAMKLAKKQGVFNFGDKQATVFCSMVDSPNAIWLEDNSARFLNSAEAYAAAASGLKAASTEWYQPEGEDGHPAFKAAYESKL